jgi:hypothetical protein
MKSRKGNEVAPPCSIIWSGPPLAFFWDQSLVWGLICLETLESLSIPYRLVSSEDIRKGCLDAYRLLLVPGGWASHKVRALGETGKEKVRAFIEQGGSYLGFCGGAGLALSSGPSLSLVPLERLSPSERLPSASGGVWIRGIAGHPAWADLPQKLPVSIWWPSQFHWHPLPSTLCLATYMAPGDDFRVADLPAVDLEDHHFPWGQWENIYGINLNPDRIVGHPAIIETRLGRGKLILSYPHLETPGDRLGNQLLCNILKYLDLQASKHLPNELLPAAAPIVSPLRPCREAVSSIRRARASVDELIRFGERHLLWRWRRPWLLSWSRGIRGLEYGMLAVGLNILAEKASGLMQEAGECRKGWLAETANLEENVRTFCRLARILLLEEKLANQFGSLTKLGKVNESVDSLRTRMFGTRMNHEGLSRTVFDDLDILLLNFYRPGSTHKKRS